MTPKNPSKPSRKSTAKSPGEKYSAPRLTKIGNLLDSSESIWVNAISVCCLTERLKLSRSDSAQRDSLITDLSRLIAA